MLENLHVKNLALIDEQEISFSKGMNILSGETGAGKSILIGSINLALGAKADKELIRSGAEYALVELVFSLNDKQYEELQKMDLPMEEDHTLLLQRKIMSARSVCRVNGETVSAGQLKEIAAVLLDIYGQHEHQSLLKPAVHKKMLDDYVGEELQQLKEQLKEQVTVYRKVLRELDEQDLDEEKRNREAQLLSFEINEIESAELIAGEDEEAEKKYRKLINAKKIKETVYLVHGLTGYEEHTSAGSLVGTALRELKNAGNYDEDVQPLVEHLTDIDDLLNDFNRSMAEYEESLEFDEEEFVLLEERLNTLNHLKNKYGGSIESVLAAMEEKQKALYKINHYEEYISRLKDAEKSEKQKMLLLCEKISKLRREGALPLAEKLKAAMIDLNFLDVEFSISVVKEEENVTPEGYDKVEFLISTNPGEDLRPLWQIASGGELSRIMLAFKTVFADRDGTDTLIFDEIDTGISGMTAWKVSEKLGKLSKDHQILCITHLPQIAAMADTHFLIEKGIRAERTVTDIRVLSEEESLKELARLLGSGTLTKAVLENAGEMRERAALVKAKK